jgi:hypothetical protein
MFVGHTAVALAAKASAPRASLGVFVAAAYALDLIWPFLLLLGIEHVRVDPGNTAFTPLAFVWYPWSHSLLMSVVWGLLAALIVRTMQATRQVQLLVLLLVVSHWVLDFVTHRADLPLWPSTVESAPAHFFGMGLWNSIAATYVVEGMLFVAGIVLYVRATRAADRIGSVMFWLLIAFLTLIWGTQPFSPPPPSSSAIAWVGLAMWLIPFWAGWIDRHRVSRVSP